MRIKFLLFALSILIGLNVGAQTASKYKFKLGNIKVSLKLMAPPNGYSGRKELYKEELLENISKPITLVEGETPMYGSKLMLYYLPNKREPSSNNTVTYTIDMIEGAKLPDDIIAKIKSTLNDGDNLSIQSMSMNDKIAVNSVTFQIKDPTLPFRALVNPTYNNEPGIYSFQIVGGLKKTLVKFDTTQEANKKYLNIYKDKSKYDILHLPGYKTKYRYIKPTDNALEDIEVDKTVKLSKLTLKPTYMYSEIALDQEYTCSLNWGKMVANPVTQSQSVEAFNESKKMPLIFNVPKENYHIIQFDMIVVPDKGEVIRYIAEDVLDPAIQAVLEKIQDRSTVYFQNIMVKNDNGEVIYSPMYYGFTIAAK